MSERKTYDKSKLIRYYSDSADDSFEHVSNKSPERAWIFALTKEFWNNAFKGKEEGRKIIYVNAGAPVELVYAFGAVPLLLDMVATRTATEPELAAKYVDAAERFVPNSMCGITKVPYAASILGEMEIPPDAMMYSTVPCDSSRISTVAITKHFGVPAFNLDVPFQANDRGYRYMAEQYREAIPFLEEVTGSKFDPDRFRECAEFSNRATELMWDIAKLRMRIPCPLPGLILYANQAIPCMAGTKVLVDYMETQYQMAQFLVSNNMSAALGTEKYRIFWMQNMLWSNIKLLSWLEKEFGAVVVMEAFGYQKGPVFENPDDLDRIFYDLARKTLALPMIHGASGPIENYLEVSEQIIKDYQVDLAMFVGHVSCKHTWAVSKLVKDMVREKFDLPTLTIDVDAIDSRYKKPEETQAIISEFMETLA